MIVAVAGLEDFCALDIPTGVEAAEIRLDLAPDLSLLPRALERLRGRTIIATCRLPRDGGQYQGSESARRELLESADWADLVDIEHGTVVNIPASRTLRSLHDMQGVPDDLEALLQAMRGEGGAMFKLALTARSLADNLRVRDFLAGKGDVAAFCMGEFGVPSRVMGESWGSRLSYAALRALAPAPGMLTVQEMLETYRAPAIGRDTRVYGVTGASVAHSLSPALHNAAIAESGANSVYLPLAARDWADFMAFARGLPLAGASVTVPFKREAASTGEPDAITRATGAANTLVFGGATQAFNTDAPAFLDDLRAKYQRTLIGRRALVLGAGGSARAVVHALTLAGVATDVLSRRAELGAELSRQIGGRAVSDPAGRYDLLVNTTPCGMAGQPALAWPWPALQPHLAADGLVYDLVYNPPQTPLMDAARDAGFAVANGLGMLHRQAARQAALFGYTMRATEPAPPAVRSHIWLVGARAAGKSTVAPLIAAKLGRDVIDLDHEIERAAGADIASIFRQRGEAAFRELESAALARVIARPDAVIATGGGVIERAANVAAMRDSGVVVYLRAQPGVLASRLRQDSGNRPSLTGAPVDAEVAGVLARRAGLYDQAAQVVVNAEARPEVVAGEITARLAQFEP